MSWQSELDFLKKRCLEREAPVIPPIIKEWFDLNRDRRNGKLDDPAYVADLSQRMKEWGDANGPVLDEWLYHTDIDGWRIKMQPFRYSEDGDVYVLVDVKRDSHATQRALKKLRGAIWHLGGDMKTDFLMHKADPRGQEFDAFWSWSASKGMT